MLENLENRFSVRVLPTRIIGRRWAYTGSKPPGELPLSAPHRIALSKTRGVIVYGWDALSESQQTQLTNDLKEIIGD